MNEYLRDPKFIMLAGVVMPIVASFPISDTTVSFTFPSFI